MVDIESDGPCPGIYSMLSLGAVKFSKRGTADKFYGEMRPLQDAMSMPEALAVNGFTVEQVANFPHPSDTMHKFLDWIKQTNSEGSRPVFVSDNPAFDWQFVNYYFHFFTEGNPFGHSARRIGDFAAGRKGDFFAHQDWRKFAITKHTHNALDDAQGNAEAMVQLLNGKI